MSPPLSQFSQNRNTRIPARVQQAMDKRMQQTMPAHLKQYHGKGAYIPKHIERAMTQHMEKSMPGHMKKYVAPYMQQHVTGTRAVVPTVQQTSSQVSQNFTPRPPSAMQFSQEDNYSPESQLFQPDRQPDPNTIPPPVPPQPEPNNSPGVVVSSDQPQAGPIPPESHPDAYEFIINPEKPSRKSLFGDRSIAMKIAIISGGLLFLLILFSIINGVLSGGPKFTSFIVIAQEQQSMIHLASNASLQKDLSTVNQNFAATTKLSLTTAQSELIKYLQTNDTKVNTKTLNSKVNTSLDEQLTAAGVATTYNQTFKKIMQSQLTKYKDDLKFAYDNTKGEKGRAILDKDYAEAELLLEQLNASTAVN